MRTCMVLALASVMTAPAFARPVSYPGGWTAMQENTGDFSNLHIHYSPTASDSIGLFAESNWSADFTFAGLQYNRLVRRWNGDHSQANLYLKLGAGGVRDWRSDDTGAGGFLGLAADWETRRWFVGYEARAFVLPDRDRFRQAARIGVAPYVGDFGDLHTWLMLEAEHDPDARDPVVLTPLVRFFAGVQLVEIGYTPAREAVLFNWIYRN